MKRIAMSWLLVTSTAVATSPASAQPDLPQLTDASDVRIPPIVIPQERPQVDRRPIYIGAGLVVLAAAFWWNRRQRERFERDRDDQP